MRIIYKPETGDILAVIPERVTSHIPTSDMGEESRTVDIDYSYKTLEEKDPLATYLEENKEKLINMRIVFNPSGQISFIDKPAPEKRKTILIDLRDPQLDPDCEIYYKKAKERGVEVKIEEVGAVILARAYANDVIVGSVRLVKVDCCRWVYEEGEVYGRIYYPHYAIFRELIEYFKDKRGSRYIDMGGIPDLTKQPTNKDEEDQLKSAQDMQHFKKKWGKETLVEVL